VEGRGVSEAEVIEKIRALRARGLSDRVIRRELGLTLVRFYFLLGRGGLDMHPERAKGVTRVMRSKTGQVKLGVSSKVLRQLGWPVGQRVRWRFEGGKLIGEPVE